MRLYSVLYACKFNIPHACCISENEVEPRRQSFRATASSFEGRDIPSNVLSYYRAPSATSTGSTATAMVWTSQKECNPWLQIDLIQEQIVLVSNPWKVEVIFCFTKTLYSVDYI